MHASRVAHSPRLQQLLAYLTERGEKGATTREIVDATGSCAVHSDVAELRANGHDISCLYVGATEDKRRIYLYRLRGKREDAA